MAAATLIARDEIVLSVELKISLLRAARGEKLVGRATVLKPGRRFSAVEAEVWCVVGDKRTLVAKASATMAVLPAGQIG